MRLDRLTLVLLIAIEAAKLLVRSPAIIDALTLAVCARLYARLHPRQLASIVRSAPSIHGRAQRHAAGAQLAEPRPL
jgi:hypothetical protein